MATKKTTKAKAPKKAAKKAAKPAAKESKTKSIDKLKGQKISGKKVKGGISAKINPCPPGYMWLNGRCVWTEGSTSGTA